MDYNFCGVILEVSYKALGNTAKIDILGKMVYDWLSLALDGKPFASAAFREGVELPDLVRPFVRDDSEYTVVLFSDTPLISKKTVYDAITTLIENKLNALRLTRGWVFRSDFIRAASKIYSDRTYYFEEEDFITIFDFKQLAMVRDFLRSRILSFHLENGVDIEDLSSTFIGPEVTIGSAVKIAAGNHISGTTVIRDNVALGANNNIRDSIIESGASVRYSILEKSYVGENSVVGPYSYLRAGSLIGNNCRIGDFVEIKNSKISDGTKLAHLAYAGDCEIGTNCNIGCGVVFANYDGQKKYKTIVGNNVFIGSNANLVAPLEIGDGAFIAAGSTLTKDVPSNSLAIARARQENKPDWKKKQ